MCNKISSYVMYITKPFLWDDALRSTYLLMASLAHDLFVFCLELQKKTDA